MNTNPAPISLIDQLRATAGVSSDVNDFRIVWSAVELRAHYADGSSQLLVLSVPCRSISSAANSAYRGIPGPVVKVLRPLNIQLRFEHGADRMDKASGINREVQLGDEGFDSAVYIATDTLEETVRAVLADPVARRAVILLLESKASCTIDDARGDISCSWVWNHSEVPDAAQGTKVLDAMSSLHQALPYLVTTGLAEQHRDIIGFISTGGLAVSLILGVPLTLGIYLDLAPRACVESVGDGVQMRCSALPECCRPLELGVPAGLLVATAISFVFWKKIRGRFNSASTQRPAILFVFVLCCQIGIIVVRLIG